jgi:hypothetical protein
MKRFVACRLFISLTAIHLGAAIAGADNAAAKVALPDAAARA